MSRPQSSDPAMCSVIFIALVVVCLCIFGAGMWAAEAFL